MGGLLRPSRIVAERCRDLASSDSLVGLQVPFLGADLLSGRPGAQAGSRRVRAEGVDALTPASTRRGWASRWSGCVSRDRKSTRLNSSHSSTSYAVFCLK